MTPRLGPTMPTLRERPLSGASYGFEEPGDAFVLPPPPPPPPGVFVLVPSSSSETDHPHLVRAAQPVSAASSIVDAHVAATAELMTAWGEERDRADRLAAELALAQQVRHVLV